MELFFSAPKTMNTPPLSASNQNDRLFIQDSKTIDFLCALFGNRICKLHSGKNLSAIRENLDWFGHSLTSGTYTRKELIELLGQEVREWI
jgi:hypothetical protein